MVQLEEQHRALRLAEEHRVLADHYATRNARQARDHHLKSVAWQEYANLLPDLIFDN